MDKLLTAQLEVSEKRTALAAFLDAEAPDVDAIETAKNELMASEKRHQAVMVADGGNKTVEITTGAPEVREFRELEKRASVGELFDSVLSHGQPAGAMAELQQHLGLQGNQVPLALISRYSNREIRAVTPAPGQVGQEQQAIIPYVFPQSAASFLGVEMPTVGVGDAVYPVLTSTLAVGTPAENAEQADTTGGFSASVLTPSRIQAAFFYSREDRARFAGMDSALRENLSAGLADGLDDAILTGTNGLFTGTNLDDNDQTTNDTFDSYLSNLVWNQVDGRYAAMTADLAMVVGAATYKDLGQTYRNTSVDRSALDRIMELVSGVRVSAHVPAPASNRQDVVIRRGMSTTAVAPIWEGVTIIPDEVTKAANGQIVITAVMLYAMKVLRTAGGLVKQGTDHS